MTAEIISLSISTKVWDRAGVELTTPGSAVRLASVARHVTDCATRPGIPNIPCQQFVIVVFLDIHIFFNNFGLWSGKTSGGVTLYVSYIMDVRQE